MIFIYLVVLWIEKRMWGFVRFGARRAKFSHVHKHVLPQTSYFDSMVNSMDDHCRD